MKFVTKKKFIPLALAGAMVFGSAALCAGVPARTASAAEDTQVVQAQALPQDDYGIMPLGIPCTTENMDMPTFFAPAEGYSPESHYVLVNYKVTQNDAHANYIYGYNGASDQYPTRCIEVKQKETKNFVLVSSLYSNVPESNIFVLRSYCSSCNVKSYGVNIFQTQNKTAAKFNCKEAKTSGTIPTKYDQEGSEWKHGGSNGNYIAFSIAYKNEVKDGCVKIPFWFTNETFVTINGVTFSVETGPNWVTVKADREVVCNNNDTLFAYVVKTEADMKGAGIDV